MDKLVIHLLEELNIHYTEENITSSSVFYDKTTFAPYQDIIINDEKCHIRLNRDLLGDYHTYKGIDAVAVIKSMLIEEINVYLDKRGTKQTTLKGQEQTILKEIYGTR
jgi:hypothetical protein